MAVGIFGYRTAGSKRLGNLIIQLHAVGDDYESPVAGNLAQHLLREKYHRKALARTLSLPEHTTTTMAFLPRLERSADGIVHADELMVLPDDFCQPALVLRKQRVILHQVEQA